MQYSSSLCLFLGLQTAMAAAVDVAQPRSEGGIEGYRTEPIVWEVPVTPGGEKATIAGTVEEVHAELLRRNPRWDIDFPLEVAAADDVTTRSLEPSTDTFSGIHAVCGTGSFGWHGANTRFIRDGIKTLRNANGQPRQGPGHGSCGRVSCSWKSAIWWCNDAKGSKTLGTFASIADGAQHLVDDCTNSRHAGKTGLSTGHTVGQIFHPGDWNVIVRGDDC